MSPVRVQAARYSQAARAVADLVGATPPRRAGAEHAFGQLGRRQAQPVEAAEQLELLGSGEVAAELLVGARRGGPRRPGGRTTVAGMGDPAPGSGLIGALIPVGMVGRRTAHRR